jgi:uncharacterized integral membrane protein
MMDIPVNDPEQEAHLPGEDNVEKPKKAGRAARATLYRVTMQNQLRSIGIVDQKANIIVGINTILISIIIAVLSMESNYGAFQFLAQLDLNLPLSILLVCCFISGIMALFVVRPSPKLWSKETPSKLFFRDNRNTHIDLFHKRMDEIMESDESVYKTLNTDMYLFGQTVIRKYRLLGTAYLIFLLGFVTTVLSFVVLHYII